MASTEIPILLTIDCPRRALPDTNDSRMKIYDLHDDQNRIFAFEIPNPGLGRGGVYRVVETIPGGALVRRPKRFLSWFREGTFCEFIVDGETYDVEEPFGDNSRYWVGPRPPRWLPQTEKVRDAFARW